MRRTRLICVGSALIVAGLTGGSALASPATHATTAPRKPATGTWNIVRSEFYAGHFTVRKVGKSGYEVTSFSAALKPGTTAYGCTTTGKFSIPGTLKLKEIKVSSKQKVWGFGKKFSDDSVVPGNVTMKFNSGPTVKAKLSLTFDPHQKVAVGTYEFGSGGYLFEAADNDCGSVFATKHK